MSGARRLINRMLGKGPKPSPKGSPRALAKSSRMILFKKLLASIGVGNARVDTLVETSRLYPGEDVRGLVRMQGGDVEQRFEAVHLEIQTEFRVMRSDGRGTLTRHTLARARVGEAFVLPPKEQKELSFSLRVPLDCPVSLDPSKVWLETRLEVAAAVDPRDKDDLEIVPLPQVQKVLDAMGQMGFYYGGGALCEQKDRLTRTLPFVQSFDFLTLSGRFHGRLKGVELHFFPTSETLEVVIELSKSKKLFGKAGDSDVTVTLHPSHFDMGQTALMSELKTAISSRL